MEVLPQIYDGAIDEIITGKRNYFNCNDLILNDQIHVM